MSRNSEARKFNWFILIAMAVTVLAWWVTSGRHRDDTPIPSPSVSPVAYADGAELPYGSYALCVRLMIDNGFAGDLCEPIEPRAEDTSRDWSCRVDGNGYCGDTSRWTWGIRAVA